MNLRFIKQHKSIKDFPAVSIPDFTVITGKNGSGKTHLLEAIKNGSVEVTGIPRAEGTRRFHAVARVALRKLIQMNRAGRLTDLAVPPGNRLETLRGDLTGLHPIRINDQWRFVFRWTESGPAEVRIMDYH